MWTLIDHTCNRPWIRDRSVQVWLWYQLLCLELICHSRLPESVLPDLWTTPHSIYTAWKVVPRYNSWEKKAKAKPNKRRRGDRRKSSLQRIRRCRRRRNDLQDRDKKATRTQCWERWEFWDMAQREDKTSRSKDEKQKFWLIKLGEEMWHEDRLKWTWVCFLAASIPLWSFCHFFPVKYLNIHTFNSTFFFVCLYRVFLKAERYGTVNFKPDYWHYCNNISIQYLSYRML